MVAADKTNWVKLNNSSQRHGPLSWLLGRLKQEDPLDPPALVTWWGLILTIKMKIKCPSFEDCLAVWTFKWFFNLLKIQELRPPEFGIMPWVTGLDTHKIHMLHLIMRFSSGLQLAFAAGVWLEKILPPEYEKKTFSNESTVLVALHWFV